MLNPDSPQALSISNLFWVALAIAAIIFLLVSSLVIVIAVRFRGRPDAPEPKQDYGRTPLEIAWTVAPILVLVLLFVLTVRAMGEADPAVGSGKQPDIILVAHQWWWEIYYPGANVVTANEIHLPAGQRMLVHLESADVIHDLWIPELGPKKDMIPGQPNDVWLEANSPGIYLGQCAEYCGVGHAQMLIRAIAQPPDDFQAWLSSQSKPADPLPTIPAGNLATPPSTTSTSTSTSDTPIAPVSTPNPAALSSTVRGALLFQQKTCISCHALNGTQARAQVGPNLTHVASRQTLAAGALDNTPANLASWISNPQKIKPGSYMPNVQLTDDEVSALVYYLETLK